MSIQRYALVEVAAHEDDVGGFDVVLAPVANGTLVRYDDHLAVVTITDAMVWRAALELWDDDGEVEAMVENTWLENQPEDTQRIYMNLARVVLEAALTPPTETTP